MTKQRPPLRGQRPGRPRCSQARRRIVPTPEDASADADVRRQLDSPRGRPYAASETRNKKRLRATIRQLLLLKIESGLVRCGAGPLSIVVIDAPTTRETDIKRLDMLSSARSVRYNLVDIVSNTLPTCSKATHLTTVPPALLGYYSLINAKFQTQESQWPMSPLSPLWIRSPSIRYSIPFQEAVIKRMIPLGLRVSIGGGEHMLSDNSLVLFASRLCYKKKETGCSALEHSTYNPKDGDSIPDMC
ncbi:hypothetical protein EVAR_38418_1 [Eumeta japonica]|uniref:Uncharacterized protein n=1 Tax=Eumeta variegata TaxID=151549 RepID=A0A4C1WWU7_EUMVA|nr:hypothetical protein EVAR_38418_1 [Eumeta japonica]